MSFKVGDHVKVVSLKKNGTVTEVLRGGAFTVTVGSLKIKCKEKDLKPLKGSAKAPAAVNYQTHNRQSYHTPEIDLHGMTVDQALRALEDALNSALLSGAERLVVVHGIGTGKVKNAALKYLKSVSAVKRVGEEPGNAGTSIAVF